MGRLWKRKEAINPLAISDLRAFDEIYISKRSAKDKVQPEEAQAQPKAPNAVHHSAAAITREEVPGEAISVHSGKGRVLLIATPHRDPGQDLVPEQEGKSEETSGGGAGEAQDGRQASLSTPPPPPSPSPPALRTAFPAPSLPSASPSPRSSPSGADAKTSSAPSASRHAADLHGTIPRAVPSSTAPDASAAPRASTAPRRLPSSLPRPQRPIAQSISHGIRRDVVAQPPR
ncbi:hypothetical protein J437_LFUL011303 [Ladona fulva]|uniref:Uncharacterized protein n=1 Tax=Ladona fulva TaxID=123851 RepID=A0A8K0K947_LADFU|nr:hypothetical protein J437_LFUL011303 [Ladona fulva]